MEACKALIMDNELVLRLLYINMDNMVHGVVMAADRPGEDKILLAPGKNS